MKERHCAHCGELGDVHLVVPNPNLRDAEGRARVGCWNTVMLTACGQLLPPSLEGLNTLQRQHVEGMEPGPCRHVTLRVDMTTCPTCRAMVDKGAVPLKDDGHGNMVTR